MNNEVRERDSEETRRNEIESDKNFLKGETPFLITQEIKNIDKWTPIEFEKRQKEMVNCLINIYIKGMYKKCEKGRNSKIN